MDTPLENIYGQLSYRCPSKEIKDLIKKELNSENICWGTSVSSLSEEGELVKSILTSTWAKEAIKVASNHAKLIKPVVTDVSINTSTGDQYAADKWHRDGIIGKRVKIWAILYANKKCAQLEFVPKSGKLTTRPKIFEVDKREYNSDITSNIISEYGERCIHRTEYSEGDIFYFDTNMLHRRVNSDDKNKNINRLAIVIEIMSGLRASTMKYNGPVGKMSKRVEIRDTYVRII